MLFPYLKVFSGDASNDYNGLFLLIFFYSMSTKFVA